jgi:hypothetical protein
MMYGVKQHSLQLLAPSRCVADVGAAVFAFDDAVCINITNDVCYDTLCAHTEPHIK